MDPMAKTKSGVLVVDKPRGPTSHDVVARIRRTLGVREVGHAGTLDPMATGVLLLAVGEATKLVPWLTTQDKTYEATIALGVETDTLDADGRDVRLVPASDELRAALASSDPRRAVAPMLLAALAAERARISQVPPAFSAIKQGGERAYARARRGEETTLAAREVHVRRLDLVACREEPASIDVAIEVGKGYYVRSLARDLADGLGTVGHLTFLRRTRSGGFLCEEALALDASPEELLAGMHPLPLAAARALPVARLTGAGALDARHGRQVHPRDILAFVPGPSAWFDPCGELVAVGEVDESSGGKVTRGFTSSSCP
jgi:tRNA pseudouridine55 synthase